MSIRVVCGLFLIAFCTQVNAQTGAKLPIRSSASPNAQAWGTRSIQIHILSLMQNPVYQKELEMTEEQIKSAREASQKLSTGYREIYERYPELKDSKLDYKRRAEVYRDLQKDYAELRAKMETDLMEQFVPNQKVILTKLKFHQALRNYGVSAALSNAPFADKFKTSEKQKKELQKVRQETEAEILKLIEEKRKAGKERMLKVLNAKQRKKFKELEGDIKQTGYTRL